MNQVHTHTVFTPSWERPGGKRARLTDGAENGAVLAAGAVARLRKFEYYSKSLSAQSSGFVGIGGKGKSVHDVLCALRGKIRAIIAIVVIRLSPLENTLES